MIRIVLLIILALVSSGGAAPSQPASGSPAKPTPAPTPIPLAKVPLEAQSALTSLQEIDANVSGDQSSADGIALNLYAIKMAAVFMISTSTLTLRTGFTPRWTAFLGFACALLLLLSGRYIEWSILVFPLWVLLISIYILIDNLRRPSQTAATNTGLTNS